MGRKWHIISLSTYIMDMYVITNNRPIWLSNLNSFTPAVKEIFNKIHRTTENAKNLLFKLVALYTQ